MTMWVVSLETGQVSPAILAKSHTLIVRVTVGRMPYFNLAVKEPPVMFSSVCEKRCTIIYRR